MVPERWLDLTTEAWAGLAVVVATVAVLVWSMTEGDVATRAVSTVIGSLLGFGGGVIVLRRLTAD